MNLAIDFGTSYTKIGYIMDQNFVSLTNDKGIPSAFAYIPTRDKLIFGHNALKLNEPNTYIVPNFKLELKSNLTFKIGNYNLAQILYNYYLFLDTEYVKPTGLNFTSVSLSIPNYFGLNARHILIKSLNKIYPHTKIYLVPEPVAALVGYTMGNEEPKLEGDILIIDVGEGTSDFSFLTFSSDLKEIILETQLQIELDNISTTEIDYIINKAKKLGLYDYTGWKLDNILLLGESPEIERVGYWGANLFAPLPVIQAEDKTLNIVKGLAIWPNIINSQVNIKTIYPFNFYIQSSTNDTYTLEPLHFDTATLELDISSQYTICSLPLNSPYNLSNKEDTAIFKIFEAEAENAVNRDNFRGQEIVLNLEIPNNIQDQNIDIILDFNTAKLMTNYTVSAHELQPILKPLTNLETNKDWLLFANQDNNLQLTQDVTSFLSEINLSSPLLLDEQLELLKYKLLTLLNYIA